MTITSTRCIGTDAGLRSPWSIGRMFVSVHAYIHIHKIFPGLRGNVWVMHTCIYTILLPTYTSPPLLNTCKHAHVACILTCHLHNTCRVTCWPIIAGGGRVSGRRDVSAAADVKSIKFFSWRSYVLSIIAYQTVYYM
jgi:hypothetical protein